MDRSDRKKKILEQAARTAQTLERFFEGCADDLLALADQTHEALAEGRKVLVFGNGGSAADAEHLAAEFVGRFLRERWPLPALALTVNTSLLTALGNDYGFDAVFERQVRAHANPGDVVVGISTSGNSRNVIQGLEAARKLDCVTVGLTGEKGIWMGEFCDKVFRVPSAYTPTIQECHIAWIHAFSDLVERLAADAEGERRCRDA